MHGKGLDSAPRGSQAAEQKLNQLTNINQIAGMGSSNFGVTPSQRTSSETPQAYIGATDKLAPLPQNNNISCGQTSVAMSVNALTGKNLRDYDVDARYGFRLLDALNGESKEAGYRWRDAGNMSTNSWDLIDQKVNDEGLPVIVALNGPEFSPSGRGHIMTIVSTDGDKVTYADPATGGLRTTTKQRMSEASSHPDGNFVFVADQDRSQIV